MTPAWTRLTQVPRKRTLYVREPHLAAALADCRAQWGGDAEDVLQRLAVAVLKPEALARGALPTVVGYLADRGLTPIAWRAVRLLRETCLTIWRYQWNKATADRVALHVLAAELTPWLLVVLRDDEPEPNLPGAVRLWGLKGPTDERRRKPDQLRSVIGMGNRMIGFVHTPDEPADILREQGILFAEGERARWLREVADQLDAQRTDELIAAAAAFPALHSIDAGEVLPRLVQEAAPPVAALAAAAMRGERRRLADVRAAFGEPTGAAATWDLVVLAAELIEHDRPNTQAILDPGALATVAARWKDAAVTTAGKDKPR